MGDAHHLPSQTEFHVQNQPSTRHSRDLAVIDGYLVRGLQRLANANFTLAGIAASRR